MAFGDHAAELGLVVAADLGRRGQQAVADFFQFKRGLAQVGIDESARSAGQLVGRVAQVLQGRELLIGRRVGGDLGDGGVQNTEPFGQAGGEGFPELGEFRLEFV